MPPATAEVAASKKSDAVFFAVLSCILYSFCSVSMVLANKALAASYDHPPEILTVVMQCVVAVVLVEGAKRLGYVQYEAFNWRTATRWLPVNIFFVLMLLTSFMALQTVNVPMITVFKNLTNIFIVFGDWHLNAQPVSLMIVASLGVMLIGATMAGANDVTFNPLGYMWMTANCLSTAGYVLYMKFATKNIKISRFGMVFYNNLLSLFLLTPIAVARGEFQLIADRTDLHTAPYLALNLFAGLVGFFLNFASLWCVGATSATTYAIVGSVNKVPTSFLGYIMFKSPITKETAVYITVSILGGFMYSAAKIWEQQRDAVKPRTPVSTPGGPGQRDAAVELLLPKENEHHRRTGGAGGGGGGGAGIANKV